MNHSQGAYRSHLGKRDRNRLEARNRLARMSPLQKEALASALGIENSTRAFVRFAADNGVAAFPRRRSGHGEGTSH